jgi:hypothetical protein
MIFCDFCGDPIINKVGVYLYNAPTVKEPTDCYFAHKGECHDALEKKHNADSFQELYELPIRLLSNMSGKEDDLGEFIAIGLEKALGSSDIDGELSRHVLNQALAWHDRQHAE